MVEILHRELSYAIVGAAMEVHRILGPGYLESVYQVALAHEMGLRDIHFKQFVRLPVHYKGVLAGNFEADFVIEEQVVVEIKAVTTFNTHHEAQGINYLAATGFRLAILLNFGAGSLEYKRLVR